MRKSLLFLTSSDIQHPDADFSHHLLHELFKRITDEYNVTCLAPAFFGGRDIESIDGVTYIRRGNALSFSWHALHYIQSHPLALILLSNVPLLEFMCRHSTIPSARILVNMPTCQAKSSFSDPCLVFHPSVLMTLTKQGYHQAVHLLEGVDLLSPESTWLEKEKRPTFVYVSRPSQPKELFDVCQAFIASKQEFQAVQLWIIGHCPIRFDASIPAAIQQSIHYLGDIEPVERNRHISRATALLVPSHEDNWGMIVYEAARVGTPAIVYDTPGLCDAVQYGMTGYLAKANHPGALAAEMRSCMLDETTYHMLRYAAQQFSTTKHLHDLEPTFRDWLRTNTSDVTADR